MSRPVPWARRDLLIVLVASGFLAAVRAGNLDERDPYWQTRAGLENLDGAPLSRPDSWSWDPVAEPFTQTSPWWNDVLGAAWRAGGFSGFFAAGFLSIAAYLVVVLLLTRQLGARPLPALAGMLAPALVALPFLSPRGALTAQTLFLAALAAAHWLVPRFAAARTAVALAATFLGGLATAALGVRLHLSWVVLAPALAVCVALILVLDGRVTRRRAAVGATALTAGLAAGVLSGPYGTRVVSLSRHVQDATTGVVIEWLPTWTPGLWPRWVPSAALALLGAVGSATWLWRHRSRRHDPRFGLAAALVVFALPTAVAGILTIRIVGLSLLTLAPLAGVAATMAVDILRHHAAVASTGPLAGDRVRHWLDGRPWRVVLTLVLVLVSPLVLLTAASRGRPVAEATALDALPPGCRLVSDANTAGVVVLLRPDVPVWIDTRADYWGRARNAAAIRLLATGTDPTGVLDRATCAMLTEDPRLPSAGLAEALDTNPEWERVHAARGVTVWVRS